MTTTTRTSHHTGLGPEIRDRLEELLGSGDVEIRHLRAFGACRGSGELFFPDWPSYPAEAKLICARCPLQDGCLDWALAHHAEAHEGVWGGLDSRERRNLIRRRLTQLRSAKTATP